VRAKFKRGTLVAAVFLMSASIGSMWQDYDDAGDLDGEWQSHPGQDSITSGANGYDQNLHELTRARVSLSFSDGYLSGDSGRE
tara:strand:- start:500 stop:748 length:249 start_codon:yes stop_codon:yes gene_type:complete